MKRLENRVAIVTGGTAGIGEATALRFAREGAQVVVWARNEARGKEMEKKAAAEGLAITFDKVDTSDFEAVTAAAKRVADKFGKIDILINNAGITNDSTLKKMTVEQWQNVIDVNLSGTFYCCKAVLNYMLASRLRTHRQCLVGSRALRQLRPDQLRGHESRPDRYDQNDGPRTGT